jgi:hypothetical protein
VAACPAAARRRHTCTSQEERGLHLASGRPSRRTTILPLPSGYEPCEVVEPGGESYPALELLVEAFAPEGPLVVGVDETLERRQGKKIAAKGIYRDPVRSSHTHFVRTSALRWVCVRLLVPIPWASRVWALPLLSALAHSERHATERGKRHKTLTEWAAQLLLLVRRWHPEREIVAVADGTYSSVKLLDRCRGLRKPITFITRLRLDAALYKPAPPRRPGQIGRPRLKGRRLPNLSVVAEDPTTEWTPIVVADWYGRRKRTVERWFALRRSGTARACPLCLCAGCSSETRRKSSPPRLCCAPTSMPIRSASSRGLSADGKWSLLSKRFVSAWGSRRKGIGRRGRSRGPLLRCWPFSLCGHTVRPSAHGRRRRRRCPTNGLV